MNRRATRIILVVLQLASAGILMRALTAVGLWWMAPAVAVVVAGVVMLELRPRRPWIVLDDNGQPATGRDADRYTQWPASLCVHQRAAWDEALRDVVARNRADRKDEP